MSRSRPTATTLTRRPARPVEPLPAPTRVEPRRGPITLHPGERLVYMIVDLDTAMPVGGPYVNVEHSRDAWQFLITPGISLSHLELIVRNRQDLVEQLQTWHGTFLAERQERRASRTGAGRGCCG